MAWMRRTGADVLYSGPISGTDLLAVDLQVEALPAADAQARATAFFRRASATPARPAVTRLGLQQGSPVAYAYCTREGGVGTLEVGRVAAGAGRGLELIYRPQGRR